MKLRICRNSLRFRLSPADVARLDGTGVILERTRFGAESEFSYSLYTNPDIDRPRAALDARSIRVELPLSVVRDWSRSDTVGISGSQTAGDGSVLEILVEKDFECLEGRAEDAAEQLYPNPNRACPPKGSAAVS